MYKGKKEKRKEYMQHINLAYGIKIEEFRQPGQACGYFHITLPIFIQSQAPGSNPVGFADPITEYMECKMKQRINSYLANEWYQKMCIEWCNKKTLVEEMQELTHIEREKTKWEKL